MSKMSISERADYHGKRRARILPFLAIIYFAQQATYFETSATDGVRQVEAVKISAWLVLSAVLLAGIATKGFWLQPRAVRDLIDDESTRANRAEAMRVGFISAMLTAIAVYVLAIFEPMTARETVHIVLSVGIGMALIRLAMLERRAHRDA